MFVSRKALNGRHMTTTFFQQRAERKRCCLEDEEEREEVEMAFTANGIPLAYVTSLKYLWQQLRFINQKPA